MCLQSVCVRARTPWGGLSARVLPRRTATGWDGRTTDGVVVAGRKSGGFGLFWRLSGRAVGGVEWGVCVCVCANAPQQVLLVISSSFVVCVRAAVWRMGRGRARGWWWWWWQAAGEKRETKKLPPTLTRSFRLETSRLFPPPLFLPPPNKTSTMAAMVSRVGGAPCRWSGGGVGNDAPPACRAGKEAVFVPIFSGPRPPHAALTHPLSPLPPPKKQNQTQTNRMGLKESSFHSTVAKSVARNVSLRGGGGEGRGTRAPAAWRRRKEGEAS
jgi:hypothetical protein